MPAPEFLPRPEPLPAPVVDSPDQRPAAGCRQLSVDYDTAAGVVHALREVDASFGRGRLSVVAGPSGSGKSSLLRVLTGLQRPRAGTIEVDGTDVTRLRPAALRRLRRRAMGIVLQDPADNLVEYLSAHGQVELAARLRGADPGEVPALLDALGLADRAGSPVPTSCRGASSSGSRSPPRRSASRRCCWPTSPLRSSTAPPVPTWWRPCAAWPTAAPAWSSPRTTPPSSPPPTVWWRCGTGA